MRHEERRERKGRERKTVEGRRKMIEREEKNKRHKRTEERERDEKKSQLVIDDRRTRGEKKLRKVNDERGCAIFRGLSQGNLISSNTI